MKRRAVRDNSMLPDELGQDSFLDTVSNLVGVLIILVVVVGAHSRNIGGTDAALVERQQGLVAMEQTLESSAHTELNVRSENGELERQILTEEQMSQLRSAERTQILAMLTQLDAELAARQASKSQSEREELARRAVWRQLQQRLTELLQHAEAVRSETKQVLAIDHHPTPIAKTVFRDDVHFQLKSGKITAVPLEKLVKLMRNEWETKAEKLATAPQISETVGPIEGFRLQYRLVVRQTMEPTSVGPVPRRSIEFDHFSIHPLLASMGESVDAATRPGSKFFARIQQLNPQQHTISVWVYPDSYPEFNELKSWLFQHGFQTASWPLSAGGLISGGPNGYHTLAQ